MIFSCDDLSLITGYVVDRHRTEPDPAQEEMAVITLSVNAFLLRLSLFGLFAAGVASQPACQGIIITNIPYINDNNHIIDLVIVYYVE